MPTSSEEIEQIIEKDFDLARKGYDRDQVKAYLRSLAETMTRLRGDLEAARIESAAAAERAAEPAPTAPEPDDDFARLGSRVAAVLQSAESQATEITDEARAASSQIRTEADDYDRRVRSEADDYARRVRADADAYAELVSGEAETRARDRVESMLADAATARRRAAETEAELTDRLRTATEDIKLTLEAFESSVSAGVGHTDVDVEVGEVIAEVREAAAAFATAPTPHDGHTVTNT